MRIIVCLALLWCVALQSAEAQRKRPRHRDHDRRWCCTPPVEFGVRGGYDFADEAGMAGTQLRVPLVRQLLLVPSGDVFFGDEDRGEPESNWQLNADLAVRPDRLGGLYAGAGAAFLNRDFDGDGDEGTEAGYNLFLGLDGTRLFDARVRPFAEGRWTDVEDHDAFRLVLGINVPLR